MTRNVSTALIVFNDTSSSKLTTSSVTMSSGIGNVSNVYYNSAHSDTALILGAANNNLLSVISTSFGSTDFSVDSTNGGGGPDNSTINYFLLIPSTINAGVLSLNPGPTLALFTKTPGSANYGTVQLSGGTATVNTQYAPGVISNIFVCNGATPNPSTRGSPYVVSSNAGTSFTINSVNPSDNNFVNYFIAVGATSGFTLSNIVGTALLDNTGATTTNYGNIALSSGSASITNTNISTNSIVLTCYKELGGTPGYPYATVDAINNLIHFSSTNAGDNSTLSWWFIEPSS